MPLKMARSGQGEQQRCRRLSSQLRRKKEDAFDLWADSRVFWLCIRTRPCLKRWSGTRP